VCRGPGLSGAVKAAGKALIVNIRLRPAVICEPDIHGAVRDDPHGAVVEAADRPRAVIISVASIRGVAR